MVTPDPFPTAGMLVREMAVGNGVLSVLGAAAEVMPEDKTPDDFVVGLSDGGCKCEGKFVGLVLFFGLFLVSWAGTLEPQRYCS